MTPYRAPRRDQFAIRVANRWLRLVASRRCVELLTDVYRRGLDPLGAGSDDPIDYSGLMDYTDDNCQAWADAPHEIQEVCPACGHQGVHHYALDGCYACKNEQSVTPATGGSEPNPQR